MIKTENTNQSPAKDLLSGSGDGIPIALGYLAVGFSLGFAAKNAGLTAFQGFISSFLTHASAGEYAAYSLIKNAGSYIEMILVIVVTNCRYLLMSCAFSQRIRPETSFLHRLLMGFCVTDEIFGASIGQPGMISPYYTYGVAGISIPAWALGSMLGIITGNVISAKLVAVLSVALYGMFIACTIPEAKKHETVAVMVAVSFASSYLFSIAPALKDISEGFRVIILTVVIAGIFAAVRPAEEAADE